MPISSLVGALGCNDFRRADAARRSFCRNLPLKMVDFPS
jgi:hypothetical protein